MKREPLIALLRKWCRKNGRSLHIDTLGGKGSHIKLRVGASATIVKSGELTPIYVQIILKQLGLPKDALSGK